MAIHKPVLLKEVIELLDPRKNQNFVDCTLGAGGHAAAILEKTKPKGKVLAIDWDEKAIEAAKINLKKYSSRLIPVNDNYANLENIIEENDFHDIDGILLDLGLSSDQLASSGRGFAFQKDEPLDMRFNAENRVTAEKIVNGWDAEELKKIFWQFGEESKAPRIVAEILKYRKDKEIKTTGQLVEIIKKAKGRGQSRIHPATKVFQALRIAVNHELENIEKTLELVISLMKPGSKIVVISFHSLEDRIVKHFFQKESKDCVCPPQIPICQCEHKATLKILTKKPIVASGEEILENPRSRSAKLRAVEIK
ncbi:MAG TPA: 16S rRNA (cytosine(1402)-N(4))-methyltransferase RsmH [Candidatus Bipolaricaulota bacterium]|nr:16S rRNA (cytosine(1402)-N(4))-methyltransferase RsmH [Candidatus Bipolaricaulota bacterium]